MMANAGISISTFSVPFLPREFTCVPALSEEIQANNFHVELHKVHPDSMGVVTNAITYFPKCPTFHINDFIRISAFLGDRPFPLPFIAEFKHVSFSDMEINILNPFYDIPLLISGFGTHSQGIISNTAPNLFLMNPWSNPQQNTSFFQFTQPVPACGKKYNIADMFDVNLGAHDVANIRITCMPIHFQTREAYGSAEVMFSFDATEANYSSYHEYLTIRRDRDGLY